MRGSAPPQVSSVPVILIFRYDAGRFLPYAWAAFAWQAFISSYFFANRWGIA
jgi:hypothetical protein